MLDELEPIGNVALICSEKETAAVDRLARRGLGGGDFGPELDAATEDTAVLGGCADVFEIGAGVGLASMGCERASVLCCLIAGEVIAEVVVFFLIMRNGKVVFHGGEIDRCSCV